MVNKALRQTCCKIFVSYSLVILKLRLKSFNEDYTNFQLIRLIICCKKDKRHSVYIYDYLWKDFKTNYFESDSFIKFKRSYEKFWAFSSICNLHHRKNFYNWRETILYIHSIVLELKVSWKSYNEFSLKIPKKLCLRSMKTKDN